MRISHEFPDLLPGILAGLAREQPNNLSLQYDVRHSFDTETCELIEIAHGKISPRQGRQSHWQTYDRVMDYSSLLSLFALAKATRRDSDLIRCETHYKNRQFRCRDHLFCPRCLYLNMMKPLRYEFTDTFADAASVWYVVISLSRNQDERKRLTFSQTPVPAKQIANGEDCELCVDGFAPRAEKLCRTIVEAQKDGLSAFLSKRSGRAILGALAGPEIAVEFMPLRIGPHTNVVLWADSFTEDDLRTLRQRVREKMESAGCKGLYPSVAAYRLATKDDLNRVLAYCMKPIDLAGAFAKSLQKLNENENAADWVEELMNETRQFIRLVGKAMYRLPRVRRYGGCNFKAHNYFGFDNPRRRIQRTRAALRRRSRAPVRKRKKKTKPRNLSQYDAFTRRVEEQTSDPMRAIAGRRTVPSPIESPLDKKKPYLD